MYAQKKSRQRTTAGSSKEKHKSNLSINHN